MLKYIRHIFIGVIVFVILIFVLLNLSIVQNLLSDVAEKYLSDRLGTRISIDYVSVEFPDKVALNGVYVEGRDRDTILYASAVSGKISNLISFRKNVVINYLGLEGAYLNLVRDTAEVWNYQFIADAFKSSEEQKEPGRLVLDIQDVDMKGVRINLIDRWNGSDLLLSFKAFKVKGHSINSLQKSIEIQSVFADGLELNVIKYESAYPAGSAGRTIDNTPFNPGGWTVRVGDFKVEESKFTTDNTFFPPLPGQFDGSHIDITGIDIDVSDVRVLNDTVFGRINDLAAVEKSGIQIRAMQGDVKVSPRISEVRNLYLKTNKSTFNHYFAMEYPRFPAFLDFIHEVTLVADVRNSVISIEDIGYFAPNMNRWQEKVFYGELRGRGTVDRLDVHHFDLKNATSALKGAFSIHGIPDMNTAVLSLKDAHIQTSYDELSDLFPEIGALGTDPFAKAGQVSFKGDMKGHYDDLTFNAVLTTELGEAAVEDFSINYSHPQAFIYKGYISAGSLALHEMTGHEDFGAAGFTGTISGNGFNLTKDNIEIRGEVRPFHYKGYMYEKIDVDAVLTDGELLASIRTDDENASLDIHAAVDLTGEYPSYKYKADVQWLDLYRLNLVEDQIRFRGYSEGELTGSSLKNMEGAGFFRDLVAIRDTDTFEFSQLAIRSVRNDHTNYLELQSEELNARLSGHFYLDELGGTFQNIIAYYLPEAIEYAPGYIPDQNFQFYLQSGNLDKYTKLIYPDLKLPEGVLINGAVKGNTNDVELSVQIPFIQYRQINASNLTLKSYGDLLGMKLNAHASDISSADKKMVSELELTSTLSKNKLDFNIVTTVSNEVDRAAISGYAYTSSDSVIFKINPSEVFFNNQIWTFQGDNEIVYAKDFLHIENVRLSSADQSLSINADQKGISPGINNIELTNINLQPILQMAGMEDLPVYGHINGHVSFNNLPRGLDADFNLFTDQLSSKESVLGEIRLKGHFSSDNMQLSLEPPSGMYDEKGSIALRGTWSDIGTPDHVLDVQATGNNARLTWAEPFVAELTSGLNGQVSGFLNFKGPFNTPEITGQARITEGQFSPIITGVRYALPETTVDITSYLFTVSSSLITDDEGHSGTVSGTIKHRHFNDLDFQLRMNSPQIKVLDLEEREGENFYGKVYASANLVLTGLLTDMTMNITATTLAGSRLFIPLSDDTDLNEYDFISFKKKFSADEAGFEYSGKTRLNIYMDALATTDLEAVIIMDPVTNEVINARGDGNLSLFIPSEGDIRLNGTYTIQTGYYDFVLSQLQLLVYKNRFNILDGSSISWDGDITGATVNVKANTIKRARLYDLITDDIERMGGTILQSERNDAMLPQNIIIDMNMTGELMSPDFKFSLSLEETRSIGTYAYQKLQRINSDDRDLLNQVVSLLVVNQFMPTSGINSNIAVNTGVSNVTEMFSTFASSQLTNFTNKILGVEDLYVNLKYKNYNITDDITSGGLSYLNRNEAGLSVRKNFFSDRIVLDLGGVYDWGRAGYTASGFSDNFAIDFRLNYLLTKDGRLRLNIFRNSNFDAVSFQNVGKQGVGINYRKSFNNIYELLGIRYRRPVESIDLKIQQNENMVPVDSLIDIEPLPLTSK